MKRLSTLIAVAALTVSVSQAQEVTVNEYNGEGTLIKSFNSEVNFKADGSDGQVGYNKYVLYNDVLYSKGATSKQYRVAAEGSSVDVNGYTDSNKANVVFLIEGEEIDGVTMASHDNVVIRASNGRAAYVAEGEVTVTSLASGKYRITVGCFDTSKAGNTAVFTFGLGSDEFTVTSAGNNLSEVTKDVETYGADLVWKASGSDTKSIDYIFIQRTGDAGAETKYYSYTVNAVDEGGSVIKEIATGSAAEGTTAKVPYPKYVLQNGSLLMAGTTGKEYNASFEPSEDGYVFNVSYAATDINNVVFLEEGENIQGLTLCESANTKIRSSNSASAYAADGDVAITTLPAGAYKLTALIYDSAKTPDSHWIFNAGDQQVADLNCTIVNIQEISSEPFALAQESTITLAQGGSNERGLDAIYIQQVDDIDVGIQSVSAETADGNVYNVAGQQVKKAAKGIFIQNGKKVVK